MDPSASVKTPTERQLGELPRWACVAYAARCARHALERFGAWPYALRPLGADLSALERAIEQAELSSRFGETSEQLASASEGALTVFRAAHAATQFGVDSGWWPYAEAAATSTLVAATAYHAACAALAERPAVHAFQAVHFVSQLRDDIEMLVADFVVVSAVARRGGWTDETRVLPEDFEREHVQGEVDGGVREFLLGSSGTRERP